MRPTTAVLAAAATSFALAACAQGGAGGGADTIAVTATDTACTLARSTAPTGVVKFRVNNAGAKVNEFYVYAAGDRIVGEVENIGPGVSRDLSVELTEPGTYTTACKPGMTGDGIRAPFTVTAASAAAGGTEEKVARVIATYGKHVASEAEELLTDT